MAEPEAPFPTDEVSEWFWSIVEQARGNRARLDALMQQMSREEIIRFGQEFENASMELLGPPFIRYMSVPSEDGMRDIAERVISQGKEFYHEVLAHPERIPASMEGVDEFLSSLSGVADDVLWERFREGLP